MLTAVGDDPEGHQIMELCRLRGVSTEWIAVMPLLPDERGTHCKNGTASWQYVENGRPAEYFNRDALDCPMDRMFREERAELSHFLQSASNDTVLVVSGIASSRPSSDATLARMLDLIGSARKQGAFVIVDPNTRLRLFESGDHAKRRLQALFQLADMVLPSVPHEVTDVSPWPLDELVRDSMFELGVREIILKKGPAGSVYYGRDGRSHLHPAPNIGDPNSSGAGDAYVGGVALALCQGLSIEQAMAVATLAAAGKLRTKGSATLAPEFAPNIAQVQASLLHS
ncbi:MAG: PfkB family carbohydrate kinase [Hyphomicrobium sp.]